MKIVRSNRFLFDMVEKLYDELLWKY